MNTLSKALAIIAAFTAASQAASTGRLLSLEAQEQKECTDADTRNFWKEVKRQHAEEPMEDVVELCREFFIDPLTMVTTHGGCRCLDKLFEHGVMATAPPDCYFHGVMSFLEAMTTIRSSCVPDDVNQVVDHHLMSVPGGTCTCPDGSSYQVAIHDPNDCTRSLSCNGGEMSSCFRREKEWMPKYVNCEPGPKIIDVKDATTETPVTFEPNTVVVPEAECTEDDYTSVWESLKDLHESAPIDGLMEVCGDLINDPTLGMDVGHGCSCINFLFEEELMEMVAPDCTVRPNMSYLEFVEFINMQCVPDSGTTSMPVTEEEPLKDLKEAIENVAIPDTKEAVNAMIQDAGEVKEELHSLTRRLQRQLKKL